MRYIRFITIPTMGIATIVLTFFSITGVACAQNMTEEDLPDFKVRPGYEVTLAVDNLDNARFLEMGDDGTLYVSRPRHEDIVGLTDQDGDGFFESRTTYVENYSRVHGLHYKDGWLWFTQTGAVHKSRDTDGDGVSNEVETVIPEERIYSKGGGHWWRSLLVGDDGIYTSIGDGGNISIQTETERQKIWKYSLDGMEKELFVSGIRNTEKLRFRPGTDEVWGADHGSDWYGRPIGDTRAQQPITDHNPPDEFNHYRKGEFYGHPFIVGNILPRVEYYDRDDIIDLASKTVPPEWMFGAHVATNGFTFVSLENNHFPPDHQGDAFVAQHGSWNSSVKVGYAVVRVLFDDVTGDPYGELEIVQTLADDGETVLERPVDCVEAPDGSILFSGDHGGRVYRITYTGR
ncbi:MAG: PQQ-dependent sugar dehydrogenase [Candidatus Marinimicrobia bacterium]|nr:PQQ-dependent sugar dehydrogenase [Candidatus Neomarinimicrobiota bacterium]MCF7828146.1 PQQ-dependent sugar dehydrogenase [Candidatus Neomarinimicrobiota bacterium]MCF7879679.1 PQQ-dependent sugar dehydrogenase [Candidatus Neomarinimicrobiota bacterium]